VISSSSSSKRLPARRRSVGVVIARVRSLVSPKRQLDAGLVGDALHGGKRRVHGVGSDCTIAAGLEDLALECAEGFLCAVGVAG
jgi:hypothetical protein